MAKYNKRALLLSVLALMLCAAMLIGTTYAWFTDTATAGVNRIQSGTLNVVLEMKDNGGKWVSAEGKTLQFLVDERIPAEGTQILWEPDSRYELPLLRVRNDGNLAFKYTIVITGIGGDAKLNNVIDWSIEARSEGETEFGRRKTINANFSGFEGALIPGQAADEIRISGWMHADAGSEYQGLSIENISIAVYATQYTYEKDSIDEQYDKDAAYKGSQEFTSGKHVLDKGGMALATDKLPVAVLATGNDTEVTITGGRYDGGSKGDFNVAVWADNGATVIIKDGYFTVGADKNGDANSVIYTTGGNIVIEGGFFRADYGDNYTGRYYVLNQNNGNPGTITVKGGTFVNFNPAGGDDYLQPTDFVAEGYTVVSETKENGDVWYTVIKDTSVKTVEEFTAAIKNAAAGDTIRLGSDINLTSASAVSKKITIDLNGFALSSTAANTLVLDSGADVTIIDTSAEAKGVVTNKYSGNADATTVNLKGAGAVFTLESGAVESNPKDNLYTIAIGSSKKVACTVNINGGTVSNPKGHVDSRAVVASNGMKVNINGGTVSGGLYALDTYAGSTSNIIGGKLFANANDGRTDEYGTSYAIHAKGEAVINIGNPSAETTPNVKGIKFESSGVKTELPTINLYKGDITNPVYSLETKYNYHLFKLGIAADAPVTFTDGTAKHFLPEELKMVKSGGVWTVTAK